MQSNVNGIEILISIRLEMLRKVNELPDDYVFSEKLIANRAHLMNVYTNAGYRRQGVAGKLIQMLIDEAKGKGVTEISLDATDLGRPLYEALGFCASDECMVMNLN